VGALSGGAVGVLLRLYLAGRGFPGLDWGLFLYTGLAVGFFSGFERIRVERLRREKNYLKTQLGEAAQVLRAVREEHRALLRRLPDVIFRADREGRVLESSRPLGELLVSSGRAKGNDHLPGLFPRHLQSLVGEALKATLSGEAKILEIEISATPNGTRYLSLILLPDRREGGAIAGTAGILRDVSERKRLEKSLARSEKLAALGTMAACVAHEIRNPLGVIRTAAFNLERRLAGGDEKSARHLATIAEKVRDADRIIASLLNFSRLPKSAPAQTDLNRLIEEATAQVAETLPPSGVAVANKLLPLPALRLDRGLMAEVFQNLIRNAFEAMPNGGTLTLASEFREKDGTVAVTVSDTGVGIPAAALPQLGTPFFSLKAQGIGLGLALSYRIVEEVHGGKISVASVEGQGTAFTVLLPRE
jgi:PAS domain S-box-containing protein